MSENIQTVESPAVAVVKVSVLERVAAHVTENGSTMTKVQAAEDLGIKIENLGQCLTMINGQLKLVNQPPVGYVRSARSKSDKPTAAKKALDLILALRNAVK